MTVTIVCMAVWVVTALVTGHLTLFVAPDRGRWLRIKESGPLFFVWWTSVAYAACGVTWYLLVCVAGWRN